jgi:HSP20 family protein
MPSQQRGLAAPPAATKPHRCGRLRAGIEPVFGLRRYRQKKRGQTAEPPRTFVIVGAREPAPVARVPNPSLSARCRPLSLTFNCDRKRSNDMANGYLTPWRRGSLTSGSSWGSGALSDLHRQINRLFDELFESGPLTRLTGGFGGGTGWPQLEIEQQDDRIEVVAELPGVDEKDIELSIEDGVLSLTGEKRSERKDDNGYSERSYGRFERRIALPSDVEEERCSADFRNGVLRVTIPRSAQKSKGRRIPIGSAPQLEAQNDAESSPRQEAAQESGTGQFGDGQQS